MSCCFPHFSIAAEESCYFPENCYYCFFPLPIFQCGNAHTLKWVKWRLESPYLSFPSTNPVHNTEIHVWKLLLKFTIQFLFIIGIISCISLIGYNFLAWIFQWEICSRNSLLQYLKITLTTNTNLFSGIYIYLFFFLAYSFLFRSELLVLVICICYYM